MRIITLIWNWITGIGSASILRERLALETSQHAAQLAACQERVRSLESQLSTLHREKDAIASERDKARGDLQKAHSDIEALRREIVATRRDVRAFQEPSPYPPGSDCGG